MAQHHITRCKNCNTIISQCRCMSPNKTVHYGICNACKEKAEGPTPNMEGRQKLILP